MPSVKKPTNSDWQVSQMRVSIFPKIEFKGKAEDLWPKVEGLVKESSFIRAQNNQSVVQGLYKNTSVNIFAVPYRIDLSIIVHSKTYSTQPPQDSSILTLGSFEDILELFSIIVASWIKTLEIDEFSRIAFGAELISEVENESEGFEVLSKYLPIKLNAETESDFKMQINKLTNIKIGDENYQINRISNWDLVKVKIEMGEMGNPNPLLSYPEKIYDRLVLDMSTAIGSNSIPKKHSLDILTKFFDFAVEISKKGIK